MRASRACRQAAGLLVAACALRAETFYYFTIAGLGGEPEYEQRFSGWAKDLDKVLHQVEPSAKIKTLYGAEATRANVESYFRQMTSEVKPDDSVVIMMIGHGTCDEFDYKFNLPGPDLTASELASMLDKLPAAHQAVINMTSASGGSLAALNKAKRVVITATKAGTEKNATVFARYWIEGMRDPAADADKNEVVTALELFRYAEDKTAKFYETQKRLATEHALLEDAGKGEGVKAPSAENGEGLTAGRFAVLHLGSMAAQIRDPAKLGLLKQKENLEATIDDLKYRKASMPLAEYRQTLQRYLLELAKIQEALDK
ncbi:MAG TPA: C13 family peptidase [Bryobacteraceae bacterium]|nr:C13 family peptidase [Bryobacteraceae bacterium]